MVSARSTPSAHSPAGQPAASLLWRRSHTLNYHRKSQIAATSLAGRRGYHFTTVDYRASSQPPRAGQSGHTGEYLANLVAATCDTTLHDALSHTRFSPLRPHSPE